MSRALRCIAAGCLLALSMPAPCAEDNALPPEIAAEIEALRPMVEEAQRIQDCAKPEMARRGLDLESALAQLDALPEAPALRENVLRLYAQDLSHDAAGREKVAASAGVRAPLLAYALRGAGTFDFPVVARALGITAVYLDRALGGPCRPSPDILTFTGAPARAD
ncbi:hypothetical protein [Lysobacter humi (ex Lee et al. 2017)]